MIMFKICRVCDVNREVSEFHKDKSWDIDHIIPTSTAKTEEDIIRLNHHTNLQPLCSYMNIIVKKDNII